MYDEPQPTNLMRGSSNQILMYEHECTNMHNDLTL